MTPKEDQQPMTTREELVATKPKKWGVGNRPFYDKALAALEDAHAACYEKHTDVLGMSSGPFSGVNEALGIIASLEEENQKMKHALRLASRQEVSVTVEELARFIDAQWPSPHTSVARALLAKYAITKRTTEG